MALQDLQRCQDNDSPYSNGHKVPSKTTNHTRHASSGQHINALKSSTLSAQKPMQTLLAKKLNKDDVYATNLLKTAYHIAKRERPKEEMKHMLSYATNIGLSVSKESSPSYTHHQSVTEFQNALSSVTELQNALSSVILEDKISQIKKSTVFSLTLDESTDRGNLKRMIMYAQFCTEAGLEYALLSNKQIEEGSACARNIVEMVVSELKSKALDIRNMVGIGTDGASVMTGRKGGVVTLLKEESLALVGVLCAAHRVSLATSQAAKLVPEMEKNSRTITSVFRYFDNSALRSNRLRAVQKLLNMPQLKFSEVHSMRWLSLEHAVSVMYRTYPALVMTLEREAHFDAGAKGILMEVNQYKFIALTHLMMDILPFVTRLSKNFQNETVNFSQVIPVVNCVIDSVEDLLEVQGVFMDKLDKFVCEDGEKVLYKRPLGESDCSAVVAAITENYAFSGFEEETESDNEDEEKDLVGFSPELRFFTQQKQTVTDKIAPEYIRKLAENLRDRFQCNDLLKCMDVLCPSQISVATDLPKYGIEQVETLSQHFSEFLLNRDSVKSEFAMYKRFVKGNHPSATVVEILCTLLKSPEHLGMPNMVVLLKCCVVIPMTSVKCERGFSTQNRIKSKFRTSLKCGALDDLMRIVEDGPEPEKMDYERALTLWKEAKLRQLYKS
ncbi:zinc finger protein 862-like [Dreissena polymorpha]|uniref:zinc finger protein 862-like n=1 Tax=Dreissena polymorpha TaxID=45954 RepID=UPI0022648B5B|nr:zinc finger protein 862-like [Dreissena polymorpha]